MESCGEGNHWEQVSTSQRSERTAYGLLSTSQSTLWEVRERLLHRLVLRLPKATLDILRAYGEDPFRAIFGLELDCGKLWRRGGFRCFLGGWLVVENARKVFFSRDPERPFDTERPRNWRRGGILCIELDCGKLWRRE